MILAASTELSTLDGHPGALLPSTVDGSSARLRDLLADRKVLLLLDNARD